MSIWYSFELVVVRKIKIKIFAKIRKEINSKITHFKWNWKKKLNFDDRKKKLDFDDRKKKLDFDDRKKKMLNLDSFNNCTCM